MNILKAKDLRHLLDIFVPQTIEDDYGGKVNSWIHHHQRWGKVSLKNYEKVSIIVRHHHFPKGGYILWNDQWIAPESFERNDSHMISIEGKIVKKPMQVLPC